MTRAKTKQPKDKTSAAKALKVQWLGIVIVAEGERPVFKEFHPSTDPRFSNEKQLCGYARNLFGKSEDVTLLIAGVDAAGPLVLGAKWTARKGFAASELQRDIAAAFDVLPELPEADDTLALLRRHRPKNAYLTRLVECLFEIPGLSVPDTVSLEEQSTEEAEQQVARTAGTTTRRSPGEPTAAAVIASLREGEFSSRELKAIREAAAEGLKSKRPLRERIDNAVDRSCSPEHRDALHAIISKKSHPSFEELDTFLKTIEGMSLRDYDLKQKLLERIKKLANQFNADLKLQGKTVASSSVTKPGTGKGFGQFDVKLVKGPRCNQAAVPNFRLEPRR